MKRKDDWSDAVRRALLDAEVEPPPGVWARLGRERTAAALSGRRRLRAIAAAAAVLLLGFVAVEIGWRAGHPADSAEQAGRELAAADLRGRTDIAAGQVGAAQVAALVPAPTDAAAEQGGAEQVAALAPARRGGPEGRPAASPLLQLVARRETVPEQTEQTEQAVPEQTEQTERAVPEREGLPPEAAESGDMGDRSNGRTGGLARSESAATAAADLSLWRTGGGAAFRQTVRSRRRLSFGLFGGGAVLGRTTTPGRVTRSAGALPAVDGNGMFRMSPAFRYDECSFRHHQPLSVGVTLRKELPHGLSVQSGAVYTYLHSELTPASGAGAVDQLLHFIGIPLRLDWRFFERRSFSLYIGAGGLVERCVAARIASDRVREPGMQLSATAAFGAQYRLSDVVGLYFEPDLSCYFTRTALETARTRSPLTFTLRAGVRFSF